MPELASTLVGRINDAHARRRREWEESTSEFEQAMAHFKRILDQYTAEYASETSDAALLRVNRVNQEISKNVVAHHTNEFDITDDSARDKTYLVVRRGQGFELTIDFNRPYDKQTDDLRIVFQFGNNPHPSKGTHAEFILSEKDDVGEWAGWVKSANGNSIVLNLVASCKAPVGKWKLNIDVVKKNENGGRDVFRYKHPNPIYILFNPWCKEDSVYLHDEGLLKEYVLNEKGTIYIGSAHQITGRPWVFGQFTGDVLDCVIYLLERHMIDRNRGNPVMVSRKISSVVNSNDNNGVLMGNWSGDYEGGMRPTSWTGSEPILSEYYKTKMPVMFGQCWVFSGVVTTVCRALGIPARSVTNFASAHDVNGSTTIDFHFDSNYETLDHADTDSIWNFHVWNDVWMARPLLPPGYGGWQAIDATPQEMSDGIFACGPCPLLAIRQGEINLPHDGPFVFSEVNGDAVYWKVLEDGSKIAILRKSNKIGKFISTSKPNTSLGKTEREDLTDQYKFKEGSEEERAAVRRAQQYVSDVEIEPTPTDVEFNLEINKDTFIGDDAVIKLFLKNTTGEARTANGTLSLSSMYYTGVYFKSIKSMKVKDLKIEPHAEAVVDLKVTADEYFPLLTDHCNCKVSRMFAVEETKQSDVDTSEFRFRKPHLTIKAPSSVKKGQKFTVEASFKNPLNMTLTKCELAVEGPGLQRMKVIKQSNLAANATFVASIELIPAKTGCREIVLMYNCVQIYAVTGTHTVEVCE